MVPLTKVHQKYHPTRSTIITTTNNQSAPSIPAVPAQAKTDGPPKKRRAVAIATSPAPFEKLNPTNPIGNCTERVEEIITPQSLTS